MSKLKLKELSFKKSNRTMKANKTKKTKREALKSSSVFMKNGRISLGNFSKRMRKNLKKSA